MPPYSYYTIFLKKQYRFFCGLPPAETQDVGVKKQKSAICGKTVKKAEKSLENREKGLTIEMINDRIVKHSENGNGVLIF